VFRHVSSSIRQSLDQSRLTKSGQNLYKGRTLGVVRYINVCE